MRTQLERKVLCHTINTKEMPSLPDGNQILPSVGRIPRSRTPKSATPFPATRIPQCLRPNPGAIPRLTRAARPRPNESRHYLSFHLTSSLCSFRTVGAQHACAPNDQLSPSGGADIPRVLHPAIFKVRVLIFLWSVRPLYRFACKYSSNRSSASGIFFRPYPNRTCRPSSYTLPGSSITPDRSTTSSQNS